MRLSFAAKLSTETGSENMLKAALLVRPPSNFGREDES